MRGGECARARGVRVRCLRARARGSPPVLQLHQLEHEVRHDGVQIQAVSPAPEGLELLAAPKHVLGENALGAEGLVFCALLLC